jgi:hypothetical protein
LCLGREPRADDPFDNWQEAELAVLLSATESTSFGKTISFSIAWQDGESLNGDVVLAFGGIISRPLARHVRGRLEVLAGRRPSTIEDARGGSVSCPPGRAARLLDHYEIEGSCPARRPPRPAVGARLRMAGTFAPGGLEELGATVTTVAGITNLDVELSAAEASEVVTILRRARTRAVMVQLSDTQPELVAITRQARLFSSRRASEQVRLERRRPQRRQPGVGGHRQVGPVGGLRER